jgi:sRNA-binding carbon storage regulator CsrA
MGGLAIGRKPGEKVKVFCNNEVLTITAKLRPDGNSKLIQLNFEGPHDFTIYREEVVKRMIAEKVAIANLIREESNV